MDIYWYRPFQISSNVLRIARQRLSSLTESVGEGYDAWTGLAVSESARAVPAPLAAADQKVNPPQMGEWEVTA
ncbi:hypothetical protein GCM10010124_33100 [Pilimelia terevasa]|uniref:Uncharacterized protein n=1 Tax=Pilimelia terevasa TaxID=53372 RepID=A0A8J3BT31_9ACTN|nr:hypothetical protein GCM10010124_33100 [Pilimelia terevasa]